MERQLISPLVRRDDEKKHHSWGDVPAKRWWGAAVAILFFLYDLFARLLPNVITSKLQEEYNVDAAEVSSAFGSSVFIGYAMTQLLHGVTLDVLGPRRHLTLCSVLAAIGNLIFAFSPADNLPMAIAGRVITGLGIGCAWLGCYKVLTLNFWPEQYGVITGAGLAVGYLGGLICNAPLVALVAAVGWRHSVALSTIAPVLCAFGFFVTIDDQPVHCLETPAVALSFCEELRRTAAKLRVLACSPKPWLFGILLGGIDAPFENLAGLWGVAYFEQSQDMSKTNASLLTSALVVVVAVSITLAGIVNNRLPTYSSRTNASAIAIALGLAGLVPLLLQRKLPAALNMLSMLLLGAGQAAVTWMWVLLVDDGLSSGAATGLINTLAISCDALADSAVGAILDEANTASPANMTSSMQASESDSTVHYSRRAFGLAFTFLFAQQALALLLISSVRVFLHVPVAAGAERDLG